MRVYVTTVTTVTVKVLQRHALRSQNLTQSHRYHHNPFHFTLFKVLIRMSTFLRRFATSASAGKNMYFILAVASALPVYTILNDNTASSASVPSRSNVFVSAPPQKKTCCSDETTPVLYPIFSSMLPSTPRLPVVLFSNFLMKRSQKRHVISVNSLLASMDLGMRGAASIESSQVYV